MQEENKKCIKILVEKPEASKSLEKYRHRWEDNIKMNLKGIRFKVMD
jgi:hypothetical protein